MPPSADQDQPVRRLGPATSMAVGSVAGAMEAISIWPMEYMKTKIQLQSKFRGGPQLPFTRIIDGIRYTVRTTGFLSLYDGLSVTLLLSIPKAGIRFGGNNYCKSLLADEKGSLTMGGQFIAGVGAGTIEAALVVTPMETLKTKMIENHLGMVNGVRRILKTSGLRGMYQGLTATILKQASNQGLRFMFYNKYKDFLTNHGETHLGTAEAFIGGMLAGTLSTLGNNPLDVVKTKMQGSEGRAKYKNTLDCFLKIHRAEGLRGFYRGTLARLGRVVPGQGIIFMTVERIESLVMHWME